jgi:hypothetical protein
MTQDTGVRSYYGGPDNPYEAIKVIEAWKLGFNLGTVLTYIARLGRKSKDPKTCLEDLVKARWYLDREIMKYEEAVKAQHEMELQQ